MRITQNDLQNLVNRLKRATKNENLILWSQLENGKLVYRIKRKVGDRIMDTPFSDRDYTDWELALCIRFALRALALRKES